MILRSVYWEIWIPSILSIAGRYEKSSPLLPRIVNFAFSQLIVTLILPSVFCDSIVTSLSGSFLMMSKKILASIAI